MGEKDVETTQKLIKKIEKQMYETEDPIQKMVHSIELKILLEGEH